MTDTTKQLRRIQIALVANNLDASGSMQQCVDRLLNATSYPKKRMKRSAPATITAANAAILDNVKNKLETLPGTLLFLMERSFGTNNTMLHSSRKVRIAKLAEHLIQ